MCTSFARNALAVRTIDPMLRAGLYWSQSRVHHLQGDPDRAAKYGRLALATLKASEQTLEALGLRTPSSLPCHVSY